MSALDRASADSCQDSLKIEVDSQDSKLEFSEDEEELIARMFSLVGQRWSLIAGRIPGRTAEEIEKYWTSRNALLIEKHDSPAAARGLQVGFV